MASGGFESSNRAVSIPLAFQLNICFLVQNKALCILVLQYKAAKNGNLCCEDALKTSNNSSDAVMWGYYEQRTKLRVFKRREMGDNGSDTRGWMSRACWSNGAIYSSNRNKGSSWGDCVELYGEFLPAVTSLQGWSLYSLYTSF